MNAPSWVWPLQPPGEIPQLVHHAMAQLHLLNSAQTENECTEGMTAVLSYKVLEAVCYAAIDN